MRDIVTLIYNFIKFKKYFIEDETKYNNKINQAGENFEHFIKNLFCQDLLPNTQDNINEIYSNCFSYTGSKNNPPDLILKDGDAIKLKKNRE